jgi:predicted RNA methylase
VKELDAYYTPGALALSVVSSVSITPSVVADFSAGEGALLEAAVKRWPKIAVIASDVSPRAVRKLRARRGWRVSVCDFLSARSRSASDHLRSSRAAVDLILLNPPFSGRSDYRCSESGAIVNMGTALAFVLHALEFLSADGEMIAILPRGSLDNSRDKFGWTLLRKVAMVSRLRSMRRSGFKNCDPAIVICRIRKRSGFSSQVRRRVEPATAEVGQMVVRGWLAVDQARLSMRGVPFVHTTSLKGNELWIERYCVQESRCVSGPVVLLPRVGNVRADQICLVRQGKLILSDCVFAIKCACEEDAALVFITLLNRFSALKRRYTGTCARFITKDRLIRFLIRFVFIKRARREVTASIPLRRSAS